LWRSAGATGSSARAKFVHLRAFGSAIRRQSWAARFLLWIQTSAGSIERQLATDRKSGLMDIPEFVTSAPAVLPGSVALHATTIPLSRLRMAPEPADTEPADLEPPPFPLVDLAWFDAEARWL
jgi:hypothetical protein